MWKKIWNTDRILNDSPATVFSSHQSMSVFFPLIANKNFYVPKLFHEYCCKKLFSFHVNEKCSSRQQSSGKCSSLTGYENCFRDKWELASIKKIYAKLIIFKPVSEERSFRQQSLDKWSRERAMKKFFCLNFHEKVKEHVRSR